MTKVERAQEGIKSAIWLLNEGLMTMADQQRLRDALDRCASGEPAPEPASSIMLYTDGSCLGNPGPGGWAFIAKYQKKELALSGGADDTTNNRMELQAAIEGLKVIQGNDSWDVDLYTDSKYVEDALTKGWAESWRKNGWQKSDKKSAQNSDLWEELLTLCDKHRVTAHWVKGHDGDEFNERCDAMAVAEARRRKRG
jgi:Ribonuclease HI